MIKVNDDKNVESSEKNLSSKVHLEFGCNIQQKFTCRWILPFSCGPGEKSSNGLSFEETQGVSYV